MPSNQTLDESKRIILQSQQTSDAENTLSAVASVSKTWASQEQNPIMGEIYRRLNDPKENEEFLAKTLKTRASKNYLSENRRIRKFEE